MNLELTRQWLAEVNGASQQPETPQSQSPVVDQDVQFFQWLYAMKGYSGHMPNRHIHMAGIKEFD